MRRFLIKEENVESLTGEYAILSYDEENDRYAISVPESVHPDDLPAIPAFLVSKVIVRLRISGRDGS